MGLMKLLIYYYGILQALHMGVNLFVIFEEREEFLGLVTDKTEVFPLLMTSAYIDFFAASPLGVLFLWAYVEKKKWARVIGLTSLSLALVSAVIYEYAWVGFSSVNIGIHVLFAPVFVLLVLLGLTKLR